MTTPELPEVAETKAGPAPEAPAQRVLPERRAGAWRRPGTIIAIVALALLAWQWAETRQRLSAVQEELTRRLSDADAVSKEARVVARNTQEAQSTWQAKLAALEAQLAEIQGQQAAFDSLYRDMIKSGDERILAEVEQGVAAAAQQLRVAGNVETALIALSGVEARLARAARPQFSGLQQMITREIERLKALPVADASAINTKIESVVALVDTLPLAFERRPQAETASLEEPAEPKGYWHALVLDFWNEMRQLVRVERVDTPAQADPGLLAPSQSFFLRENLKLRLLNARLAMLMHDGRAFRDDIVQTTQWLERYFDGKAKPVQSALITLRGLQAVNVGIDLPDLTATLEAVRNFKLAREKK